MDLNTALADEYNLLFSTLEIDPGRLEEIARIHEKIKSVSRLPLYAAVEKLTNVPWFVIAIFNNLEAGLRVDRHLHNGDKLTGRTTHVPPGRPALGNPPFTWVESAADALTFHDLDTWKDWSVAGIAFKLELFNGTGYRRRHPHVKSPYLWSFSNIYVKGKYVADGTFSQDAVSQQCGGMVLLKYMIENDPEVRRFMTVVKPQVDEDDGKAFPKVSGSEDDDDDAAEEELPVAVPPYPGYFLRNGARDDDNVKLVQGQLKNRFKIDAGSIDGDYGEVTENAVSLFQARSTNLAGDPLEIDGIVGRDTWIALFGYTKPAAPPVTPAKSSLVQAVIAVASAEVGVREKPLGSNRGPKVDQYIKVCGLNPAEGSFPWCMCFVYWCFQTASAQLGIDNSCPRSAGVHVAWNAARASAKIKTVSASDAKKNPGLVTAGMIFFLDTGGGKGHAGIVISADNGVLRTIEGNTNDGGSREGIGVFSRSSRKISSITLGFASVE